MARIQVLQLSTVEGQIEDLSYDMTDSIRGGGLSTAIEILVGCFNGLIADIGDGVNDGDAFSNFADCYVAAVNALLDPNIP